MLTSENFEFLDGVIEQIIGDVAPLNIQQVHWHFCNRIFDCSPDNRLRDELAEQNMLVSDIIQEYDLSKRLPELVDAGRLARIHFTKPVAGTLYFPKGTCFVVKD